jgi:glutamate--cysteine ligase
LATYNDLLAQLSLPTNLPLLTQLNRGIEKEGLRASNQGIISQTPHPKGLGSALTHPSITTDYSESLLEFITPVMASAHEAHAYLDVAHRFAYSQMDAEVIWPSSMPCILQGEMSIPIAYYGSSNLGQLKHVYRHGLWHRYGRTMQCIAGIHYNFSLPEELWQLIAKAEGKEANQTYISAGYLRLIRNFRRYSWLLIYLFGASPAVCSSFLAGRKHTLDTLHQHTLYAPYATSLRMSDLGYQNNAQSELTVCHNSLARYIETLGEAISVPVAAYEAIGMQDETGQYKQLNTNLLQIENEFYSDVRPKRIGPSGEKPLESLARAGIQYIEVRCTDVNPFMPVGIDIPQMQFMDVFLTWCALHDSPNISDADCAQLKDNLQSTVMEGRRPGLMLKRDNTEISLQAWGIELIDDMMALAEKFDQAHSYNFHLDSLYQQRLKLVDSSRTPSAQVLAALIDTGKEFSELTLDQALQHRKTLSEPLGVTVRQQWTAMAQESLSNQRALEENDNLPFEQYLKEYLKRD